MPQNTGTATLTVTVLDVNDNFPDFAQPIVPTIKENVVYTNGEVTTFSAKDADTPDNGPPFTFELRCIQGSQCNKFNLIFNQRKYLHSFPAIHNNYCLLSHLLKYFDVVVCKHYEPRSDYYGSSHQGSYYLLPFILSAL